MPTLDAPHPGSGTLHEPAPEAATVPEALVQDLWAQQRFDTEGLKTTDGEPIAIRDPGRLNTDAGPDFQNAHVRIGGMDWRGQVEVHTTSGGWFRHDHHTDPRFNSVVLHVTLHADMWTGGLLRADESALPELALYPRLDTPLRELLYSFRTRADDDTLPCASRWDEVPSPIRTSWIRRLAQDRLTEKRDHLPDPSDTSPATILHERLFAGLGYAKNDAPMTTLARRTPPAVLRPLDTPPEREALLFGTAGLLPEPGDLLEADRPTADYTMALRDHFRRLQVRLDVLDLLPAPAQQLSAPSYCTGGGVVRRGGTAARGSGLDAPHGPGARHPRRDAPGGACGLSPCLLAHALSPHEAGRRAQPQSWHVSPRHAPRQRRGAGASAGRRSARERGTGRRGTGRAPRPSGLPRPRGPSLSGPRHRPRVGVRRSGPPRALQKLLFCGRVSRLPDWPAPPR